MNILGRIDQLRPISLSFKFHKDQNSLGELFGEGSKEFGLCPDSAVPPFCECGPMIFRQYFILFVYSCPNKTHILT